MKGSASCVKGWADLPFRLTLLLLTPTALFVAVSASSFVAVRLIPTLTSHEILGETPLLVAPHGKSKCEDGEPDCKHGDEGDEDGDGDGYGERPGWGNGDSNHDHNGPRLGSKPPRFRLRRQEP